MYIYQGQNTCRYREGFPIHVSGAELTETDQELNTFGYRGGFLIYNIYIPGAEFLLKGKCTIIMI